MALEMPSGTGKTVSLLALIVAYIKVRQYSYSLNDNCIINVYILNCYFLMLFTRIFYQ